MDNTQPNSEITLNDIREQFKAWRLSRGSKREPIPEHLWHAAAELCKSHKISHVCRALRLSSTALKKRFSQLAPKVPTQFMQLEVSGLAGQWCLECDRPNGARLRLSGSGSSPDIEKVLGAFLS